MQRTVARLGNGVVEPEVDGRNRDDILEAKTQELEEWWGMVLEMSTQIEPLELRRKFLGLVNSGSETKRQVRPLNPYDFMA